MPTLAVSVFAGEIPRIAPRLLETQQATLAVNCDLARGLLQPLRAPGAIQSLSSPAKTIFRHTVDGWLSWSQKVDVVKSAIFDADGERPLGQLLMTGARDYPIMYLAGGAVYRLGIPRPAAAPTAATASGAALRNVEAVAFAANSVESAPGRAEFEGSPILTENDVTMTISAVLVAGVGIAPKSASTTISPAADDETTPEEDLDCASLPFDRAACLAAKVLQLNDAYAEGRRDWTEEEVAERIADAGFDSVREWWDAYGDEESVCPWDSASCCRKAGYTYYAGGEAQKPEISRSSSYCYTVVQRVADGLIAYESAPSPPSDIIDVLTGDGVTLSGFVIPKAPDLHITHVRIYRTVAGNESSDWRFLTELSVEELSAAGWRYEDTTHDKDVSGEVLQTSTWDPIPDNARGLIKTDNGIYACFRGNELLLSEPFYPYAYPSAYRLTVEDSIVALAHVDNTIVILTEGRPYLAQGTAPDSMQLVHLPIEQSCIAAGSVATLPGGVIYASPDGLMLFSSNQQSLLTEQTMTREQWQALGPERLLGSVHDGRYVGFFEGTGEGLLFHIGRADVVRLRLPEGWIVRCLYHHGQDDALYLAAQTPEGEGIWRFEGGTETLPYRWHSKHFFTSSLCGMTAARVQGAQNACRPVLLRVFGPDDRRCRDSLRLSGGRTVRLRPTRTERLWSFELSGNAEIYEVRLGSSVEGVEYGQ